MKFAVIQFPGSNDDRDALHVVREVLGAEGDLIWHKDTDLKGADAVLLPGGFSYGDYLRCGAMARFSPIMNEVRKHAEKGGIVFGVCNGFQVLCESGLLPGALIRNRKLRFICKDVQLRVENTDNPFFSECKEGEILTIPIKHGEGSYFADAKLLERLGGEGQILLRYVNAKGEPTEEANPNGSVDNIAGVCNAGRNVFGMMPHPEHAAESLLAGADGKKIFDSIVKHLKSG